MSEKFDPVVAEWKSFASSENYSLVEKCLKLSQILEYPELDISKYIEKLNEIGNSLKFSIKKNDNPTYKISILNEHLFENCGFIGDKDDYYNPKNNFLNEVIEKKSGIPITLAIIYSEIAKYIGLDLRIVGFPSHIVVKYGEEMILDPFNGGKLLSIDDLNDILFQKYGEEVKFSPEYLNEIMPEKILIRMTRNLKNSYVQSYAYDMAMRCINMTLALEPISSEEIRDKGILQERLLNHDQALTSLNQYLEINPNADDVDFVLDLIKSIREKINQR
ncbi:MAG: transglutaminase family protein [Thaumarchaeota archaeon]|nr:transglutaminase family protein [Nitrososphaerota archaeon]